MFCPNCGSNQSDDLKFCKSCGSNLQAVRQAITTGDSGGKFDWSKTWLADMIFTKEEVERLRGITPEMKRHNEIKAGVITSCVGIGLMIFLYIFMEGLVLSGKISPSAVEIISRIWAAGIIPFFIGIGLLINGLFVSKKMIESSDKKAVTGQLALGQPSEHQSLGTGDASEIYPQGFSVTEQTTRQLGKPGLKE